MSQAIKCDKCGKFNDPGDRKSCLKSSDINFGDLFTEGMFPHKVDLCETCTDELLELIRAWCKGKDSIPKIIHRIKT